MNTLVSLIVVGLLATSLTGCSNEEGTKEPSSEPSTKQEEVVNRNNTIIESDNMKVEINGVDVVENHEGTKCLEITYTYTNKQEQPQSALIGTYFNAFQNGKQLEVPMFVEDVYNEQTELQQGITQEDCKSYFAIKDDSEITLEVKDTTKIMDKPVTFIVNLDNNTLIRK